MELKQKGVEQGLRVFSVYRPWEGFFGWSVRLRRQKTIPIKPRFGPSSKRTLPNSSTA